MVATIDMEKSPMSEITTEPTDEESVQQRQQDRLNAFLKEHGVSWEWYMSPGLFKQDTNGTRAPGMAPMILTIHITGLLLAKSPWPSLCH